LKVILIAALAGDGVIGENGKIPWRSEEETAHFKSATIGFPVIMGRKTWDSIGNLLIGRFNVILTRNREFSTHYHETAIFYSYRDAIDYFRTSVYEKVFVIGGGEIFREAIKNADEMLLSEMKLKSDGNVYFPWFDGTDWLLNSSRLYTDFILHHYIRKENLRT
jgi:dihydrofolate reductase